MDTCAGIADWTGAGTGNGRTAAQRRHRIALEDLQQRQNHAACHFAMSVLLRTQWSDKSDFVSTTSEFYFHAEALANWALVYRAMKRMNAASSAFNPLLVLGIAAIFSLPSR